MNGGHKHNIIDEIEIKLKNDRTGELYSIYIDTYDTPLSNKWLKHLNQLINDNYFLEKNYCFLGFANSDRDGSYIIEQINKAIYYINNNSNIDYHIDDWYTMENSIRNGPVGDGLQGGKIIHEHYNMLHRYFEELQGTAGKGGTLSPHFLKANEEERFYIRQLNLLCHEFESWAMSKRKSMYLPEWQRLSQIMCWMNAPRFELTDEDYENFGIETLNRPLGGVYVGVNKAVGKHHWEVFQDEYKDYGRDKDELTTIAMRSQSQAAGDFDIEWGRDTSGQEFMITELNEFRKWLIHNNLDPEDKSLTIGHPKCGQVNLIKSFGTEYYNDIWKILQSHLNVYSIKTSDAYNEYNYNWDDDDFVQQSILNAHAQIDNHNHNSNVEYDNNVWNSSSGKGENIIQDEISDDIMQQVNVLMGLSSNIKKPSNIDLAKIKELKENMIKLFAEYGV